MKFDAVALTAVAALAALLPGGASSFAFSPAPSSGSRSSGLATLALSSHPNPSMIANRATNEEQYLNNFLGAAGASDPYKPIVPQEPVDPWGVVNMKEPSAPEDPVTTQSAEVQVAEETPAVVETEVAEEVEAVAAVEAQAESEIAAVPEAEEEAVATAEEEAETEVAVAAETPAETEIATAEADAEAEAEEAEEEAVATAEAEEELSSQSRYLDSQGASYVDSLAEGRRLAEELEPAAAAAAAAPMNGETPYFAAVPAAAAAAAPVNGDAPNGADYVNGGGYYVNGGGGTTSGVADGSGSGSSSSAVVEVPGFVQTASASAIATAVATTAADLATAASDDPSETISRLTALLASRDSELAALREEHRAVKTAARDLLGKYYDLAEGLEEVETALMKCAEYFPDPDDGGFESYEWLLSRQD